MIRRLGHWLWGTSVRRQLIIGVALVHLLLMTIFVFDLVHRQREFLMERARSRVILQAQLLAASSIQGAMSNDLGGLSEILSVFGKDNDVSRAMVTDSRGRVLADMRGANVGLYRNDQRTLGILSSAPQTRLVDEDVRTIEAAAPIMVQGRVIGWAWVARNLGAERTHLAYVTHAGLIYTAAAILIGTVFAFFLAQRVTRQLRLLLAGTHRMAINQLDRDVPVTTSNEVGQVTRAFNAAMHQLSAQQEELQAYLKELESFSYTISHDLRAPLRAIDGFSKMLSREEGEKLGEDSRRKLRVIQENVRKMGQLIDDLLAFFQVGRQTLSVSVLNMEQLVKDAWIEQCTIHPERNMELKMGKMPEARGDPALIRQVFANLLSNSVKFSGNNDHAMIEVTGKFEGNEVIYSVKDNGVGFNMRYYNKLFGVFERLHSEIEYEGTGVGLAIVQRVIHRHGGRVWAEGEVGKGATFFFSLPIA